MPKTPYEILGVSPQATMQEIEQAYYALRDRYREEMYQEGALGKAAARRLNEIEQAYSDICAGRVAGGTDSGRSEPIVMGSAVNDPRDVNDEGAESGSTTPLTHSAAFDTVQNHLNANDLRGAQSALDAIGTRDAEWHYYQAMIYYKKKWLGEAIDQMQMACGMAPDNAHYAKVLERLQAKKAEGPRRGYNEETQGERNNGYHRSYTEDDARRSEDSVCRFCETLICINCLCDCCCRG